MFSDSLMKKIGLFAGGVLFGTAGVKILSSKDAKKVYTTCTAAALRAKDCVMKTQRIFLQKHSRSMRKEPQWKKRQSRRRKKTVRPLLTMERCNRS